MGNIVSDYREEVDDMKLEYLKKTYERLEKTDSSKEQLYLIKKIIKNEGDIPELEKYLSSDDIDVKVQAYKYMFKTQDLNFYKKYILKGFVSRYNKIRKICFDWYAEDIADNKSSQVEEITNHKVFNFFLTEYNTKNQISFVKKIIENSFEETVKELMEITKDKISSEAYSLFKLKDKAESVLSNENSSNTQIKEASKYLVENLSFHALLELLKEMDNIIARRELSKAIVKHNNNFGFSLKASLEFLNEEEDLEVMVNLMKLNKKLYKSEGFEIHHVDKLINSEEPKYQAKGFEFGATIGIMNYVDYARSILNTSIDENLISAAAKYLLYFQDYELTDHLSKFLNSKSKKLKMLALSIMKKLKITDQLPLITKMVLDSKNPVALRKSCLTTIISFKAQHLSNVFREIAFNEDEDLRLRETALKGVLLFSPEFIQK